MAIEASAILPSDSLEELRVQFNNIVSDVEGIAGGNAFLSSIIFEGSTADAFETTVFATDPTADRTVTLANVSGTVITTGNADSATTTTSTGDVDHILVNDGGVLKKITSTNLGIGSTAADDIAAGDAAVSIATSAGNITIDAQAGDTDIIFKGTDDSSDITALTLDMSDAGKAIFNGAISATTITLSADGGVVVPDNGNIGSASSTAAMQIASTGIVTFVDDILIKNGGTIGSAGVANSMSISSAGVIEFSATTEASATGTAAVIIAGGLGVAKDVWIGDDVVLDSDGAIVSFGDNQEITLTHVHNVGLTLTHVTADDNLPIVLQLKSEEDVIIAGEVIASLEFAAGDSDGTDGATVAAGIHAIAEGTFAADANATKLVFTTGVSETAASSATAKMTLSSAGLLTLADDLILKDAATIGVTSSTSAITIASTGIVTLVDDLLLKDVCTIGTATTAGAIAIAADGLVNLATAAATVNGAVIKTAGLDTIWIPAAAMRPTASNPCADITTIETTSGRPDMQVLDFDASSDEHAQFQITFPKSWNEGTVTAQFYWCSTATDTDGVSWGIQGVAVSDNGTIDVAYGTAIVVDDANQGAAEELCISAATAAITIAGSPAVGDLSFFRVFRDISDSNDDATEDARLVGVNIFFTTDATNDA